MFDCRRAENCTGYLEFIDYNGHPAGLIVQMSDGLFHGMHCMATVAGETVASVKEQLFPIIEATFAVKFD